MVKLISSVLFAILLSAFAIVSHPLTTFAAQSTYFADDSRLAITDANDSDCTQAPQWDDPAYPSLAQFAASILNTQSNTLVGVYVCDVLALRVTQQPADDPVYVSGLANTATQFRLAARYGTIGLLAHNSLAGSDFFKLAIGRPVALVFGDGSVRRYIVSDIHRFQSINPDDPYSDFIDLDQTSVKLSSTQVFQQFFGNSDRLVFQTCIGVDGKPSWGRLFVTASPVSLN